MKIERSDYICNIPLSMNNYSSKFTIFIHPFIVKSQRLKKFQSCCEEVQPYIDNDRISGDTIQMISGLTLERDLMFLGIFLEELKLPYLDYSFCIKPVDHDGDNKEFILPNEPDLFLGVQRSEKVEFIEIQKNIYPFPGVPRIYMRGIHYYCPQSGIRLIMNTSIPDGLMINVRNYSNDSRERLEKKLENFYDDNEHLMYNQGNIRAGYRDEHGRFYEVSKGSVEQYHRRNKNSWAKYSNMVSQSVLFVNEFVKENSERKQ
jgi:hypothetical protein